jgi:site-specific DNA-cytosine methylase
MGSKAFCYTVILFCILKLKSGRGGFFLPKLLSYIIAEMITVATDCSGIDAPIEALKQLGVSFKQLWYCDNNKYARETSEANHPKPEMFFDDMLSRNNKSLPHLDLYICGFPCQSFSLAVPPFHYKTL